MAASTLTVADAEAIAELPGVQAVAPVHPGTRANGVRPEQLEHSGHRHHAGLSGSAIWPLTSGMSFTDSDVRSATRVALLGQTSRENLFGDEDPVGKTIRIRQSPFVVLGVLAAKGQSLDGRDQDDTVLIPVTTAQRKLFGRQFQGTVRMIMVQARSAEAMPAVEKSMNELLRQRHRIREGADNDFTLRNLTAAADSAAETTRVMSLMLGAIASVSLLVGGIGIMNIMLVSVTERTREIGIRMAIGARERDILLQFLLEAIIISVIGCLIGLVLGIGGALLVEALTGDDGHHLCQLGRHGLRRGRGGGHLLRLLSREKSGAARSDRGVALPVKCVNKPVNSASVASVGCIPCTIGTGAWNAPYKQIQTRFLNGS